MVENGTIEHLGEQNTASAVHMYCAIYQYSGSTTINDAVISTPTYRSMRLWHGDMTINGGNIKGQVWVQTQKGEAATLTINGGTFAPCGVDGSSVYITNDNNTVDFAVTGGIFTTKIGCYDATALAGAVKGGSFSASAKENTNSALIADGFAFGDVDENGYYVIVATRYDEYLIDDDEPADYVNERDITVETLTYKRNLVSPVGKWNAFYVPFSVPMSALIEDYDVAYINNYHSYDTDNDAVIDSMTQEVVIITNEAVNLKANYPYLIRAKSEEALAMELVLKEVTLCSAAAEAQNAVTCESSLHEFVVSGSHKGLTSVDLAGSLIIATDGTWKQLNEGSSMKPHRLYLTITEKSNSPYAVNAQSLRSVCIVTRGEKGEDTTGIDSVIDVQMEQAVVYDLQGRPVENPSNGVYIVNGKKVYIK